ncbi:MAG: hypothetical protein CG440_453 [Methanosaeta sp. NSM2]|nr:DUF362 domain-containing protein [Methanothrix sp.]OYV14655.1 MAG: hypothetical protein CG440_453 [Methanosaeta sp. NSM2]
MSFIIDPPLLLLCGLAIYLLGKRLNWSRHAKMVVGLAVVLVFVVFSVLLYADIIDCTFPFFSQLNGSTFMFHSDITHIYKPMVPKILVLFLFLLYPIWILAGYSIPLLREKKKRVSKEVFSYSDVKSKSRNKSNTMCYVKKDSHTYESGVSSSLQEEDEAAASANSSIYSVKRGRDTRKCVQDAVESLGGIGRFVKKNDKVLVKVNICGGVPEKMATFTSIDVADALADLIISAGGKPIFADADMIWVKFWPAARDSGYVDWAKKKGVDLVNLSETEIVHFDFGPKSALGIEKVSRELIEADVIISVPTMKTHLLTGVTLAMKNMYGTFPDIDKAKFHKKGIEETILEVNTAFTPNLVIIDGSVGGEAIGPLSATPVNFQTIIASSNVVTADSIACQLMGYSLPYPHPGKKDGNWDRPDPEVKDFYEWGVELILMFPGWDTLFNMGADFLLYDTARLPVLRYLVPTFLQLLHDFFSANLRGIKSTTGDVTRRVVNVCLIGLVALGCAIGYYQSGYFWKSSLLFELGYILAIAVAALASARMKTIHIVMLLVISSLVSYVVEHTNMNAGLLQEAGSTDVSLFTISGWIVMMVVILQLSDFLAAWLKRLQIFQEMKSWRLLPFLAVLAAFLLFASWEGYLGIWNAKVGSIYAIIACLGLFYSWKHPIEWNASLVVVSVAVGGYMELLGSLAGFWTYHFHQILPVFFALSWAVNSMAVHGLAYILHIDLGDREARHLLPEIQEKAGRKAVPSQKRSDPHSGG